MTLDGEVTTWLLGADWNWGQWTGREARRSTARVLPWGRHTVQLERLAGEFSRTTSVGAGQLTTAMELGLRMRSDNILTLRLFSYSGVNLNLGAYVAKCRD